MDTSTTRVIQTDDRRAVLHRHIHDFADFFSVGFRERTTKYGEVLREHIDHTAIDGAPTCDNAVTRHLLFLHTEVGAAVRFEHVKFFKATFV